jgi:hypothetical protein
LKDSKGENVWIGPEILDKLVVKRVEPKLPSSVRADGKVAVDIILSRTGQVLCARALEGHPLLKEAVTEAVMGWTFKPYRLKGKAWEVFGHLNMTVSTSRGSSGSDSH